MPNVAIYNISGAKVGEMELSENIFGCLKNINPQMPTWQADKRSQTKNSVLLSYQERSFLIPILIFNQPSQQYHTAASQTHPIQGMHL